MISISFGDYNDKKPGRVYRKVTAENIIYYHFSPFPPNGPMQYMIPVIEKIIPRRNYRDDDNNQDIYYRGPPMPYPNYYYYPYPYPYYYPPQPYRYRSFAGFQFGGGSAPSGGFNYDPNTKKVTPTTPSAKDNLINKGGLKSGEAPQFGSNSKGDPNLPYLKDSKGNTIISKNKDSGCDNCRYGDTGCEILKAICETGHGIQSGFGQWGIPILIGGGLILVILLVK